MQVLNVLDAIDPKAPRPILAGQIYRANMAGYTYKQIAKFLGWYNAKDGKPARGRVARYVHDHRYKFAPETAQESRDAAVDPKSAPGEGVDRKTARMMEKAPAVKEFSFGRIGAGKPVPVIPVYNGGMVVTGDAVVAADFHAPFTNWPLLARAIAVARQHLKKPRRLMLIGDLLNMDAVSHWPKIVPEIPMTAEIDLGEQVIDWLAEVYDEIIMVLGNHEHRLFKLLEGDLDAVQFGNLLSKLNRTGKLKISPYSFMILVSGGEQWRLTHPANYSRNKTIVGSKLANKYKANVIVAHQHHAAISRDEWNTYTVIDNGGLFDISKMAYTQLVDNTSPVMSEGFSIVRNGTGDLLTPYPTMSDWDRWLPASVQAALPALVPWQDRVAPVGLSKLTKD